MSESKWIHYEAMPHTCFYTACVVGDLDKVIQLHNKGVVNQIQSWSGQSSFWAACFNGHLEIVKYLAEVMKVPTDADPRYNNRKSPFSVAVANNHLHIVRYLNEHLKVDLTMDDMVELISKHRNDQMIKYIQYLFECVLSKERGLSDYEYHWQQYSGLVLDLSCQFGDLCVVRYFVEILHYSVETFINFETTMFSHICNRIHDNTREHFRGHYLILSYLVEIAHTPILKLDEIEFKEELEPIIFANEQKCTTLYTLCQFRSIEHSTTSHRLLQRLPKRLVDTPYIRLNRV